MRVMLESNQSHPINYFKTSAAMWILGCSATSSSVFHKTKMAIPIGSGK